MTRVELRGAMPGDCEAFAPMLREADALELRRSSGGEPLAVLLKSVSISTVAGVLLLDGEMAAMYGLVVAEEMSVPWMLTSSAVEKHRLSFFRTAKTVVDKWASEHPVLVQMVDAEYVAAQRFLESIGFKLFPPVPHGPLGAPFCPAVRTTNV